MHFRSLFFVLGNLLVLLAGLMLVPLVATLTIHDHGELKRYEMLGFLGAIAIAAIAGFALRALCETKRLTVRNREGSAIVTLTWVLFSLVGCLPYVITGAAGFTDAYFETMSGFTTTGATIFPQVEVLPAGLQLWRHQTQWMGGMGIVVLSVAILPILGIGGYRMFKAEAPGGTTFEREAPRIKDTAKLLWEMYLAMSLLQAALLMLGGMTVYEAICHTFTTMSTGGFSTSSQSIAHWPAPFIQWTLITFMFLAGGNFNVYHRLIKGPRMEAVRDPEFRAYLLLAIFATVLNAGILYGTKVSPEGVEPTVRASAFAVTSIGTTTGYGTEDFNRWPDTLRLLLILMMFVGGCAGSTAGGMKVIRMLIFSKAALNELRQTIRPRAVMVVRVGDRAMQRDVVANIMGFLAIYIALFALVTYALSLWGMDLLSASSATASNLGNVGPGLGTVGPTANYAHLPGGAKWVLVVCMLLGRLELYSPMALLLKQTWVR